MKNGEIPENANEHCPGPQSETARESDSCAGCPIKKHVALLLRESNKYLVTIRTNTLIMFDVNAELSAICMCLSLSDSHGDIFFRSDLVAIAERMVTVKHKILVFSCKGGVGKSTFSAQLSFALARMDHQVGLMDLDICAPSMPKMLGLEGHRIHQSNFGWSPAYVEDNLGVVSIGLMNSESSDKPAIWRGPRKNDLIKRFLKEVYWGEIDFLVVDSPPGTSDEHIITIVKCLLDTGIDGAIIVTTPQEVSIPDVRKGVSFCKKAKVPVIGVVENMSGLSQPLSDFRFIKLMKETSSSVDVTQDMISCIRDNAPELLVDVFA